MGSRLPLLSYVAIVVVGMVLLGFASRPVVNRYIDQHVAQTVTQQLDANKICRETVATGVTVRQCRDLIDRISRSATNQQRHNITLRLLRTLTPQDWRSLGFNPPPRP